MLKILNDIYTAADNGSPTCLVALDLSAAFDTLDHVTLLDRLETSFGLTDSALEWIRSYLTERSQRVCTGGICSPYHACPHGVPQGSVLGPILFSLFVAPVAHVIRSFDLTFHQYADDTQLYISVDRRNVPVSLDSLDSCTGELEDWFTHNGLALNPSKSEVMFLGTRPQVRAIGQVPVVKVAGHEIHPSDTIKNLGVVLDSELTFSKHIDMICKASCYHIRALRHIKQSIDSQTLKTIACAIVGAKLDYCNSILHGISVGNLNRLQRVQNMLARVVTGTKKFDHITPILKDLHWLPMARRIDFKLATIVFNVRKSKQPEYLSALVIDYEQSRSLRSENKRFIYTPRTNTKLAGRRFSSAAPAIWNNLPCDIRTCEDLGTFKA